METRFQQLQRDNGMLPEPVLTALNIQMNHELTNFYVYKNFSGIADFLGLTGTCKWFDIQANEEKGHFDKFYKYISDKGYIPQLLPLPDQATDVKTLQELFAETVQLEARTTENLRKVAEICKLENDDQTYNLSLEFLSEQIEEEKIVNTIFKRIMMSINDPLRVDEELGKR